MKSSNRYSLLTLLVILCVGVAVSASILRLPAFRQSAAPAQAQLAPAPGDNDASDDPANADRSVTLRTDKTEYSRGEVVIITGSGWDPGEAVTLLLHEEPAIHADRRVTVIADASGNILDNRFIQDVHYARFYVTAVGRNSGLTTQAAFGNPAANLDQCADGTLASPVPCNSSTGAGWVNGDLNSNNSHYRENDSVPFRLKFSNLSTTASTTGTNSVLIQWDTTKGGKHAYDYLTSYKRTVTTADACAGISGCGSPLLFGIPPDPNVAAGINAGKSQITSQSFTCYNCDITSVDSYVLTPVTTPSTDAYLGDSSTSILIHFNATVTNPVLAWGGHIASSVDWAAGGAASVSGSPYHMRVTTLNGASTGNQDRSLKAAAVLPEPNIVTSVSPAEISLGASTTDTATFSAPSGSTATPAGTASFFACGPTASPTSCVTNGADAGALVSINGSGVATSNAFTPSSAGYFCFRVEYTPSLSSPYSPAVSTTTSGECVHVTAGPSIRTTLSTSSGNVGTTAHDSATLSGETSDAGGTVTYTVYTDDHCSQGAQSAGTKTVTNGVVPDSDAIQFNSAGDFYWQAAYSGDANNGSATSTCTSEHLVIGKAPVTIATTLSATTANIGDSVHDSSTLSGETSNAGGTVTYTVYTDNACSQGAQSAGTKTVTNGGVPDSDAIQFNSAGDFYWQAAYSGDANNGSATSTCTSEHLVVSKNKPDITTAQNLIPNDDATLSGATSTAGGKITFSLFSPSDATCSGTAAYTQDVTVNGNGTYSTTNTTFIASTPGTWRWLVVYNGDANNEGKTLDCGHESFCIVNAPPDSPTSSSTRTTKALPSR